MLKFSLKFIINVKVFLRCCNGATGVEYGLIVSLLALSCTVFFALVGFIENYCVNSLLSLDTYSFVSSEEDSSFVFDQDFFLENYFYSPSSDTIMEIQSLDLNQWIFDYEEGIFVYEDTVFDPLTGEYIFVLI